MKLSIRLRTLTVSTITAAALIAGASAPAFASDGTTATVTGGGLAITNAIADDFTPVQKNGAAQTTTAGLGTFSVSDATGTGAGWHVTAQASKFTVAGIDGRSLALGSLQMSQPTVTANGTSSTNPGITTAPYTLDNVNNGAVSIASAGIDSGMGTYGFSVTTLTLALPADVYVGAYASTVILSAVTAP
jgi:hypothetical protein